MGSSGVFPFPVMKLQKKQILRKIIRLTSYEHSKFAALCSLVKS